MYIFYHQYCRLSFAPQSTCLCACVSVCGSACASLRVSVREKKNLCVCVCVCAKGRLCVVVVFRVGLLTTGRVCFLYIILYPVYVCACVSVCLWTVTGFGVRRWSASRVLQNIALCLARIFSLASVLG